MPLLRINLIVGAIIILTFLIILRINLKVYTRVQGVTLVTPAANIYIPSQTPIKVYKFDPQPQKLTDIIKQDTASSSATFGIYLKNLNTGQEITINPDKPFVSASLYKLTVMYTIYKKASLGQLDINRPDIQQNLKAMIEVSSNDAAYYLVNNFTSWSEITTIMHSIGLTATDLNQDPTITSPHDIGQLLELISDGKAVSMDASVQMLKLMLAQQINDRIPVYLPAQVEVAHKTGDLYDNIHDAGVVIGPENNYILVLMSTNSNDQVKPVMSQLSLDIYNFFKNQWANPPEIL